MNGARRGFTIVEGLVAVVLLGVGIAAVMGGLTAIAKTEGRTREIERMQRLALDKYQELSVTNEAQGAAVSGDFADRDEDQYRWSADLTASGVENLNTLSVTVTLRDDPDGPSAVIQGLKYEAPDVATTTGAAP